MNHKMFCGAATVALACASPALAGAPPVELGVVDWERVYETGLAQVRASQKPMLLLFQEVPG